MTVDKNLDAGTSPIAPKNKEPEPQALDDANESTSTRSEDEKGRLAQRIREYEVARAFWRVISWTPKRCRWDPESPPKFSLGLNILFGFVSNLDVEAKPIL
jgi:hypothetical protein